MENIKHAYLIIAHNDFYILEKLLQLLDNDKNDIYLHIDKKVRNFNFEKYKKLLKKSSLFFVKRYDCRWGHFSLVQCELELLKSAANNKNEQYSYYHLLSGVDLPLKTQEYIHNFFEKSENNGKEFIHFCKEGSISQVENRILYYHYLKYPILNNKFFLFIFQKLECIIVKIQIFLHLKRKWPSNLELKYGSQWFSITDRLVKYILSKEQAIYKLFKYTSCSDELFLQTFVYNSDFINDIYYKDCDGSYEGCKRLIDWKRGNPYTFSKDDYDELITSDKLFARKFNSNKDKEIIDKIFYSLKNKAITMDKK